MTRSSSLMTHMKTILLSLLVFAGLLSCHQNNSSSTGDPSSPFSNPPDAKLSCANALQGENRITEVVSANLFSCALQKGKAICWGDSEILNPPPIENVTKISAYSIFACAMNSHSVKCW